MKNRLIELISGLPFSAEYEKYNSLEFAEHLADHLLANGVIVPPCKAGDIVYVISKGNILPFTVNRIIITNYIKIKVDYILGRDYEIKYLLPDHFGKTVFLTKEEAEEKLKELQNA